MNAAAALKSPTAVSPSPNPVLGFCVDEPELEFDELTVDDAELEFTEEVSLDPLPFSEEVLSSESGLLDSFFSVSSGTELLLSSPPLFSSCLTIENSVSIFSFVSVL